MKIGFVQPYSGTHLQIYSYHPDYNSIPDDQRARMPEWRALPDDYEPQVGMYSLMDKSTGEISFVSIIPIPPEPTIEEYAQLKAQELLSTCYAKIYDKFTIWDKWFACDTTARDDINDLYYAYQKPDFMGRYWFTAGGLEVVYITPEMVIPFKDAVVEWKDSCWNRYAYLSNQLKLVDLKSKDAKAKIDLIVW